MSDGTGPPRDIAFPARRPEIVIEELGEELDKELDKELGEKPFAVDCRELRSHFIIPELGQRARWAMYDPPAGGDAPHWELAGVSDLRAVRPALVHDLKGVEIEVVDRDAENDWEPERWTMYGRLTEETAEWLATVTIGGDERRIYTFLDEGFDDDWGRMRRRLADTGELVRQPDGSFRTRAAESAKGVPEDIGAGVFRVRVGKIGFECLRVLDVQADPPRGGDPPQGGDPDVEHGILVKQPASNGPALRSAPLESAVLQEAFVARSGRTVLSRRYNASLWGRRKGPPYAYGTKPTWEEELPENARIVIDGVTFVHWSDCLSGLACGLARVAPGSAGATARRGGDADR